MQVLITDGSMARSRVLSFSRWQLITVAALLVLLLMAASGLVYHYIFLKAAREGWPLVSQILRVVVIDEMAQRDRFMRENLDAIAQKVGEVQAKLVKLEAMGERVGGLAGVKAEELKPLRRAASAAAGGPYVPLEQPSLAELQGAVEKLDQATDQNTDIFILMESRLLESRLQALLIPSSQPVDVGVGSGFGIRPDPWTGRPALHTGLDFPAEVGTPVQAAAGGIVVTKEWHPAYGNMLEIDHGNGLMTRYAHNSAIDVELGAVVRRGQRVARVGNTGRSTGPHLHFEVLLDGVPQNPARFLAGKAPPPLQAFARRPQMRAAASGLGGGGASPAAHATAASPTVTPAYAATPTTPTPIPAPVPAPAAEPAGPAAVAAQP